MFIGRTGAEAETPILWPPDVKSWLIGKERDVGKDWRQEEKGTTEDEMVGWHHRLNGLSGVDSMELTQWSLSKLQELVMHREAWRVPSTGSQRVGHDWATELNWCWVASDSLRPRGLQHVGNLGRKLTQKEQRRSESRLVATPRAVACQAPLSVGSSRLWKKS